MKRVAIKTIAIASMGCVCGFSATVSYGQGAAPGPYEILPFESAFIVEAFTDLLPNSSQIADWTGWTSDTWISPNAYNNHRGTDFSAAKGTPVYASAAGEVVEVVDTYTGVNYSAGHGNYVKIVVDGVSPRGEELAIVTAHMQKGIPVQVGDLVETGDLLGYSHTTGNSTTEHVHVESSLTTGSTACAYYNAHYKYPIMLNPSGKTQVGHVVRVKVPTAYISPTMINDWELPIPVVGRALLDQYFFATHAKRGQYRIFLPDDTLSGGWIRATDVDEVLTGTVLQTLPDSGPYTHPGDLATSYPMFSSPGSGSIVGYIRYGGQRFMADQQAPGGWYRIADPARNPFPPPFVWPGDAEATGSFISYGTYGWVQADENIVVYPELYNPAVDLPRVLASTKDFPYINNFTETGRLDDFGRMKFHWNEVKEFSPPSPGGDGKALHLTDHGNIGLGAYETLVVGRPEHTNYYVQADVYFNYLPSYGNWERYGVFLRDDGFGGFDQTFEGAGNCYAMTWDSDDGFLRCGKIVNGVVENQPVPNINIAQSGWHTMRIEAQSGFIRFYLDGILQRSMLDGTFVSGLCGLGYHGNISSYPAARGAYFDNFIADVLPVSRVSDWCFY